MALKLYDTLNPSGDFPLVSASDVEMGDGSRLEEFLNGKEVDIHPLTTYSGFAFNDALGMYCYEYESSCNLTVGETYMVVWDGNTFECVAQDGSAFIEGAVMLGSVPEETDEPFLFILLPDGHVILCAINDTEDGGSHTVRIYQGAEGLAEQVNGLDERVETLETPAVSVDMTAFEESGTIVENRADGYTVEHTMEFDESGVPVKLTTITKNEEGEIVKESETELVGFSSMTTPSYTAAEGVSF